MKIVLGIIIGITLALSIRSAFADDKFWKLESHGWNNSVEKIHDANISCYVFMSGNGSYGGISCLKRY